MEYTRSQLTDQMEYLRRLFDEVFVVDAATSRRLDTETMQPTDTVENVPDLDERGRAWRPLYGEDSASMAQYWSLAWTGALRAGGGVSPALPDERRSP